MKTAYFLLPILKSGSRSLEELLQEISMILTGRRAGSSNAIQMLLSISNTHEDARKRLILLNNVRNCIEALVLLEKEGLIDMKSGQYTILPIGTVVMEQLLRESWD